MKWPSSHCCITAYRPLFAGKLLGNPQKQTCKSWKRTQFSANGYVFQSSLKITPHGTFSETCVWFFRFSFSNKFFGGQKQNFYVVSLLLQHVYCQQKWGPPRLKMRAICIDTPIIGFDNVKPCVTFTTSMAAFFTLQHVRSNKILQKMLLWCQKWIL